MFKNRFLLVLGLLSLLLVAMSVWEEAERIQQSWAADTARWEAMGEYYANQADAEYREAPPYIMDSATRSYIARGQAMQVRNAIDSGTRSYIAWGEALGAARKLGDSGASAYLDYYQRHPALRLGLPTSTYTILNPSLLDECFDVSLSEVTACRASSKSPAP